MFPWFWKYIGEMDEPREDPHYSMAQILSLALFMFACRIPSLRQLDLYSDDENFLHNWCVFSRAKTETVVCSRQMTNVLAMIEPGELAAIMPHALKEMLRNKQAPSLYLLGHVMMAADGTGIFSSSKRHCEQCLYQNHKDGTATYLHNVLEIKAVGWDGLAISVLTEAQLNDKDKKPYDKQDCETKAYHRALARLKQWFPREPIVHLLDSLYCQGPMFRDIRRHNQKFICCFKRGSIPTLYDEAIELRKMLPENRIVQSFVKKGKLVKQVYTWVTDLQYQEQRLDFVMCEETVEGKTTTFAVLTNFHVTKDNAQIIADGGRKRWTIENEGFNEQKTGYELEHFCDCKDLQVMLCLYALLQIAHLLMQLLARSDLVDPVGHLTVLAKLLLEALRNLTIPEEIFDPDAKKFQIRFAKAPP